MATLGGVLIVLLMALSIHAGDAALLSPDSFTVVDTYPAVNALAVSPTSAITITFSDAVDADTVSALTLVVRGSNGGSYPGQYSVLDSSQMRFQSAGAFKPGEVIQVTATSAIMSTEDESLLPHSWQFTAATVGGTGRFTNTLRYFGVYGDRIALGDLDSDGDLDAVTSNRYSQVWLNSGQGVFSSQGQKLDADDDIALGDLDQDGDLDAFVTGSEDKVWLNNGQAYFSPGPVKPDSASFDVALGDIDGDADLDALLTGRSGEDNALLVNDGNGTFHKSEQRLGSQTASDIALGDLDGDGDLDAFLTIFEKPPEIWVNDGGIYTSTAQSLSAVSAIAVALGDIDGDGDLDAFLAKNGPDHVLINDGHGQFSDSGQELADDRTWAVSLGDVDSDGDLDALMGGHSMYAKLWINDGAGVFSEVRELSGWASDNTLGDVDGDGDLDAILVAYSDPSNVIWMNHTPVTQPTFYISGTLPTANAINIVATTTVTITFNKVISSSSLTAETIRLQGDQMGPYGFSVIEDHDEAFLTISEAFKPGETLVATFLGSLQSQDGDYLAPRTWQFTVAARGKGEFVNSGQNLGDRESWSYRTEVGDVDGDGDLDALVMDMETNGGQYRPLEIWHNDGSGNFSYSGHSIGDNFSLGFDLGDLDGDGDLDLFVATKWDRPNTVWFNDGSGLFTNSGQGLGNANSWDVALGDLDNDGDLDAYVANNAYEPVNRIWLNDGRGFFATNGQGLPAGDCETVELGDLDGDGDLDAVAASRHPNTVWINLGDGTFISNGQELGYTETSDIALGDLDGDGDLDAFAVNDWGQANEIWLNDGNGLFSNSGQRLGSTYSMAVSLGDVDGDGDLDAFVAERGSYSDGDINRVWLNNGSGLFHDSGQELGSGWLAGASFDVSALADLNGDGALDAFVANLEGHNQVWLNRLNLPWSVYLPSVERQ